MAKRRSSSSSGEEVINHYGAVRLRAKGIGNLQLTLYSLDESLSTVLAPIPLQIVNNIEQNRLSNFTQQRSKLEIKTTNVGEIFVISKIIVFTKPIAKSWPETS